jgi:hypothetical protein
MFNLNKTNRNTLMSIGALILVIFILMATQDTSMYQPRPIRINAVSEKSMFDLENRIECTPGNEEGSAYTKNLTPGGLCGAQQLVSDYASYGIEDGIGGSLI